MTFQKLVEFCSYAGGQPCTSCGLSLNDMSDSMYERDKLRAENARYRKALNEVVRCVNQEAFGTARRVALDALPSPSEGDGGPT